MTTNWRTMSSWRFGAIVAGAHLAAGLLVGGGLVVVQSLPDDPPTSAANPTTTTDPFSTTTPPWTPETTTTTTDVTTPDPSTGSPWDPTTTESFEPVAFQRVEGPAGMSTFVPADWPVTSGESVGSLVAHDPGDPTRELRFGASPAEAGDIRAVHEDYAAVVSERPGYELLRFEELDFHGTTAIDWEFTADSDSGPQRVRSRYWRVDGYEHFVYAASSSDRWDDTLPLYTTMIEHALP